MLKLLTYKWVIYIQIFKVRNSPWSVQLAPTYFNTATTYFFFQFYNSLELKYFNEVPNLTMSREFTQFLFYSVHLNHALLYVTQSHESWKLDEALQGGSVPCTPFRTLSYQDLNLRIKRNERKAEDVYSCLSIPLAVSIVEFTFQSANSCARPVSTSWLK